MLSIRQATARDLPLLPAIERAAAGLFRVTPYPHLADSPLAIETANLTRDRVWVAEIASELAGFALVHTHQDAMYIHEIDVHPKFARQGIGAALIRTLSEWAREQGVPYIALSTFDNVPWNAPYYGRLGFDLLPRNAWTAELHAERTAEQRAGLPMEHRVCMRLRVEKGG